MKFETVRIYLVKWRFWFVVWSKNFATVATWRNKKNNNKNLARAQHTFLNISLTLVCTTITVKLPNSFCVGKCRMCSLMFCHVPVNFFFYSTAHFYLVGRFFSFSHRQFPCFSKFVSCFLSNALALLSTSLETLKFCRTCLCCSFFSLLSPDGLSLSKKSRWTLGFPPKNPVLHLPYLLIELVYIGMPVVRKGVRTLTWLFMHSEPKFLPMVHRCARVSFAKNVFGEPRRQKHQNRPLSPGSHFVSGDLKTLFMHS